MELLTYVFLGLAFFSVYKIHTLITEFIVALRELIETQEIIVGKIDKIAACLDGLPYNFKQDCGKTKEEIAELIIKQFTTKTGKLKKAIADELVAQVIVKLSQDKDII